MAGPPRSSPVSFRQGSAVRARSGSGGEGAAFGRFFEAGGPGLARAVGRTGGQPRAGPVGMPGEARPEGGGVHDPGHWRGSCRESAAAWSRRDAGPEVRTRGGVGGRQGGERRRSRRRCRLARPAAAGGAATPQGTLAMVVPRVVGRLVPHNRTHTRSGGDRGPGGRRVPGWPGDREHPHQRHQDGGHAGGTEVSRPRKHGTSLSLPFLIDRTGRRPYLQGRGVPRQGSGPSHRGEPGSKSATNARQQSRRIHRPCVP
jgi:hypothetical protein